MTISNQLQSALTDIVAGEFKRGDSMKEIARRYNMAVEAGEHLLRGAMLLGEKK